jgi:hypothetical protein
LKKKNLTFIENRKRILKFVNGFLDDSKCIATRFQQKLKRKSQRLMSTDKLHHHHWPFFLRLQISVNNSMAPPDKNSVTFKEHIPSPFYHALVQCLFLQPLRIIF